MSYRSYDEWERQVPADIRGDLLWKMEAYRLALFLGDLAWADASKLYKDLRTRELSDQLYRAVGSIGANIAEGYSRSSGRDRVRFYEYSLGSARESRDWYFKARHIIGDTVATHRIHLCTQITRLLLTMISDQRTVKLQEETIIYNATSINLLDNIPWNDA